MTFDEALDKRYEIMHLLDLHSADFTAGTWTFIGAACLGKGKYVVIREDDWGRYLDGLAMTQPDQPIPGDGMVQK